MGSERFELWIDGCATAAEGAALADVMEPATGELLAQGAEAFSTTPAQFDKIIKDELAKWEYVIKAANIKAE